MVRQKPGAALRLSVSARVPRDAHGVVRAINRFNVKATGHRDGRELAILLRDGRGRLRGGLLGYSWGGWVTITYLWIHATQRGRGLGTRLMAAAEREARQRRCRRLILSTYSFQARPFYEGLGYRVIAEVPDYPIGHTHYVLEKRLGPV